MQNENFQKETSEILLLLMENTLSSFAIKENQTMYTIQLAYSLGMLLIMELSLNNSSDLEINPLPIDSIQLFSQYHFFYEFLNKASFKKEFL